jgi:hypothetical protein
MLMKHFQGLKRAVLGPPAGSPATATQICEAAHGGQRALQEGVGPTCGPEPTQPPAAVTLGLANPAYTQWSGQKTPSTPGTHPAPAAHLQPKHSKPAYQFCLLFGNQGGGGVARTWGGGVTKPWVGA